MISVLCAFRAPPGSWRDTLRATVEAMWSELDVEFVYGSDGRNYDEPFNAAAALNAARAEAKGDMLLAVGCDLIPPSADDIRQLEADLQTWPWAVLYENTRELSQAATQAVIDGAPVPGPSADDFVSPTCTGIHAMRTEVWDRAGGYDERFDGWGFEDTAMRLVLSTFYRNRPGRGTAVTLWHPRPTDQWSKAGRNDALFRRYQGAVDRGRLQLGVRP